MSLDVGTVYTATLALTDATTGAPVNPVTAVLTVTNPDQTVYVSGVGPNPPVTLPPAATGLLIYPYTLGQEGLTKFAWSGTLSGGAAFPPKVDYINARSFRSAVSLAETTDHLGVTDPARTERIRSLMGTATAYAERIVGTLVPRVFTNDWIPGAYRPIIRLPHGPALNDQAVTAIASVYPNGPSWSLANGDFVVNPYPGTVYLRSLLDWWYGPWHATYTAGVSIVHEDIAEAILEIIRDLYTPARGLSVDIAEQASEQLAMPPFYHAPPRAQMLLDQHKLPGFA